MSGIFGVNRCEIWLMTSCMRAWFFICFRAFMILYDVSAIEIGRHRRRTTHRTMVAWMTYLRSSSTIFCTSDDSAFCSALIGMFRLMRIFFDLKSARLRLSARHDLQCLMHSLGL